MLMYRIQLLVLVFFGITFFTSCGNSNKMYFHDLQPAVKPLSDSAKLASELRIKQGDRIFIHVTSSDPTLTAFLNPFPNENFASSGQQSGGYLVNRSGEIDFPMLGTLKVDGYTSDELTRIIKTKLSVYYKDPYVYVNLTGRIYFINGRSGTTISLNNQRLTLLEAIAQSGTQDIYDRKNQMWLIREENGERTYARLDLTDKKIFDSPYFYLHNNDVLYLQPGKFTFLSSNNPVRTAITFGALVLSLFLAIRKI